MRRRTAWIRAPRPEGEPDQAGRALRTSAREPEPLWQYRGWDSVSCGPAAWSLAAWGRTGRGGKGSTRDWKVVGLEARRHPSQPCGLWCQAQPVFAVRQRCACTCSHKLGNSGSSRAPGSLALDTRKAGGKGGKPGTEKTLRNQLRGLHSSLTLCY